MSAGLAPQWRDSLAAEEGDPPARFQLRPLSPLELIDFSNGVSVSGDGEGTIAFSGQAVKIALGAVLQWEGVLGPDEKPLPCTPANRERLPAKVLVWISMEVMALNALQESEKKTS